MKKDIDIDKLIVNAENYRFDPVDNQDEAIELMLNEKGEEIYNLAKHIYEYGIDKAKDARVYEIKKNLYTVLDGNRRVTAIKCLNDTGLIKDDRLRTKFVKLLKEKGVVPDEVNCYVYKTEEEAAEWIKLDHTGKNNGIGQDPWESASKDRFDYKFGGKISPAMQLLKLYEHETKQKIDTKKLKITTISRIISNPESRSYIGIDIKAGNVILVADKTEVIKRLDQLFNKIIVDDVAVKEVYRTEDSIDFMSKLLKTKPTLITGKPVIISPKGSVVKTKKDLKSIPSSTGRNTLIPKSCVMKITEVKVNNIYHELRTIQLDQAPNAMGVLFRVFLETSIDCYAKKQTLIFPPKIKLADKITKVTKHMETSGFADSVQLKNIRTVANKGTSILSIDNFNQYVHSFTTQPAPVDLILKWDNLEEFFKILWNKTS